jgi:hypothetical protein
VRDKAKRFSAAPVWAKNGLVAVFVLLAASCLAPAGALATETHTFDATLSLTGTCATSVADSVPDPAVPACPSTEGAHPPKRFKVPREAAIDEYGDIYIANKAVSGGDSEAAIDIFDAAGYFLTEVPDHNGVQDLAVDSQGNLYAYQMVSGGIHRVVRYAPKTWEPAAHKIEYGSTTTVLTEVPFNISIAVDSSNDHLYVDFADYVNEYGSATEGNPLLVENIGSGMLNYSKGLAIDASSHDVYAGTGVSSELSNPAVVRVFDGEDPKHPLLRTIDGSCLPVGHFGSNTASGISVAIDESNGHVFVGDGQSLEGTRPVYEFTETGGCVSTIERTFEPAFPSSISMDNGAHSPNGALDPNGRYLYVPSGEVGTKSHLWAFGPVARPKFALTVKNAGAGAGSVKCKVGAVVSACAAEYAEGTKLTLVAGADPGSEFAGFSGDCSGSGCALTMNAAHSVTATFNLKAGASKFALKVKETGTGTGTVVSSPTGIECGATCSAEYEEGTEVTLTASPAAGSTFAGWSGSGCLGTGTCKVTMSEAKSVSAEFGLVPQHTLTVTVTGNGSVSANQGAILGCTSSGGPSCEGAYAEGTKVTLTEAPGAHARFTGWGTLQCDESTATTCEVEVNADEGVAAGFVNTYSLAVSASGTGTGKVTGPGIDCGSDCEEEFDEGKLVELKAEAASGSLFKEWSGACTGASTCKVTMSAAQEVTASFEEEASVAGVLLTVAEAGEGTVVSSPGGIDCGATCSAEFEEGSTITLTASPASGYAFSSWGGCTTHLGLACTVEMSKAKTVKALFVATPSLTVGKIGSGAGKVMATGISCDENCSKASSAIKAGTSVTLKVTPARGSEAASFEGGTGSASGCSGASCSFTISENSSVKVKFDAIPTSTLTVNVTGPAAYKGKVSGKGIVKGLLSSAINCGMGCTTQSESFFSTDEVTLSAAAGTGYTFGGWEGEGAGTCKAKATICTVPTSTNQALSAEFE